MGPKRAKAVRKRPHSPDPPALESDTLPSTIQARTCANGGRVTKTLSGQPQGCVLGVPIERAGASSLNKSVDSPAPESDATPSLFRVHPRDKRVRLSGPPSPPPGGMLCGGVIRDFDVPPPNVRTNQLSIVAELREIGALTVAKDVHEQDEGRERAPYREHEPDHEARIDWYIEVAMEKLKSVLQRANDDKLSRADLWEFLIFGQHMYAGMKQQYDIDLNTALVERTVQNAAKGLTPLGQRDNFPWDLPAPRRCHTCSRVIVEDLDPLSPRRPWNSPPMTDAEIDKLNRDVQALGADRCGFRWSPRPPVGFNHRHEKDRIIRCYAPPKAQK